MRVLPAGWSSSGEVIATVGDEPGAEAVAGWLVELGIDHDVAWAPYLERGRDGRDVDPAGEVADTARRETRTRARSPISPPEEDR